MPNRKCFEIESSSTSHKKILLKKLEDMNMTLNKTEIKAKFKKILSELSFEEKAEHEKRMLMVRFLAHIENEMKEKKISKKELAKKIKTSPSYITQLFRGDKTINFETLAKIKKVLELNFNVG